MDLLRRLHERNIRYCHWKSNEHLQASLQGETDLDVLVARCDTQPLAQLLAEAGFKRCLSSSSRSYPGIESHIGFDVQTGRLVHLHLHYQLTLGERYLKGYRLPWEHVLLATRIFSKAEGIYVADPHLELLLLTVRASLKLGARDRLRASLATGNIAGGLQREFAWLIARTQRPRLAELSRSLVGERATQRLDGMVSAGQLDLHSLVQFRSEVEPSLDECRSYTWVEARARRLLRGLGSRWSGRRRLPQGGLVIALLGADGSGKSTVVAELAKWLSPHLDLTSVYFGTGQGSSTWPRRLLKRAASLVRRTRTAEAHTPKTGRSRGASPLRTAGEILWFTTIAWERTRRAGAARRARNRGVIVICDRFPQSQFAVSDGPRLEDRHAQSPWIWRAVARRELEAIRVAERVRPDLVIRLNVTAEVAARRKPDTPPDLLVRKLAAVGQLKFPPETRVVETDATLPLSEVILEVKRAIWARL